MNLRALRSDVGRSVRVLTSGDDAVTGTLMRVGRGSLEVKPEDFPEARIVLRRDDIFDVEVRHQTGFIQPNWVDGPSSYLGGGLTISGRNITPTSAVEGTIAIYAGVSLLSDVVGSLPMKLYKRVSDAERERITPASADRSSPGVRFPGSLARLVGEMPNPESTANEMWTSLVWNAVLWGAGYAQVIRGSDGRPSELWPLYPDRIERRRVADENEARWAHLAVGTIYFRYEKAPNSGRYIALSSEEVLYIPLSGSMDPLSPIRVARNAVAAEQSQQEYEGRFYANSAMPSSIVTIPKGNPEKFADRAKVYRASIDPLYAGAKNAGRIAVIEEGVTWDKAQMSMLDMQFIDTRKYTLLQAAILLRIPPHKLGYMDPGSVSYASVEQQNLAFYTDRIRPLLERIEARVNVDLGLVPGRKTLLDESIYAEFDANAMLRSDNLTRAQVHATNIQWGVDTRNEARADENLPPIDGLDAPIYPANMTVVGQEPAVDPAAQLASAVLALTNREQVPPRVTVNNHPPAESGLAEKVEGLSNEIRAVELLGRMKDDLEAFHTLRDETRAAQDATAQIAQEMAEATTTGLDRAAAATSELAAETRAVQTELFTELESLKQPRVRTVVRNSDGFIESIVDETPVLDPAGTVAT